MTTPVLPVAPAQLRDVRVVTALLLVFTVAFFVAFCVFPQLFPWLAVLSGCLCFASAAGRILAAGKLLK